MDGYGILVEGFENRQMMTMMNYNNPYIPKLVEALGFEKEVDFVSCYVQTTTFRVPERVHSIADRVVKRGTLAVKTFATKRELLEWAPRIGKTYNQTFVNNWEYYPLTEWEIKFVVDNIMTVANPKLIKVITHDQDVVGFLFAFPDVSEALQRSKGHLLPFSEGLKAASGDGGMMNEHIRAVISLDEAETFPVVEPLHCSLCHSANLLSQIL